MKFKSLRVALQLMSMFTVLLQVATLLLFQQLPGKSGSVSDSENEEVTKDVEEKEPHKKRKCI